MLADILFRLKTRGIDVCFNVNRSVADTFCVVSCASMALERFFLVTAGHLMWRPAPAENGCLPGSSRRHATEDRTEVEVSG